MKLYIDLHKAVLNKGKLVLKRVPIRGENGMIHYGYRWVNPNLGEPHMQHHDVVQPSDMSSDELREHHEQTKNGTDAPLDVQFHHWMDQLDNNDDKVKAMQEIEYLRSRNTSLDDSYYKVLYRHVTDHLSKKYIPPEQSSPKRKQKRKVTSKGSDRSNRYTPAYLDMDKLYSGAPLMDMLQETLKDGFYSAQAKKEATHEFEAVFKGITIDGLEHVFSDPDNGYTSELDNFYVSVQSMEDDDSEEWQPTCYFTSSFNIKDRDGNEVGNLERIIYMRDDTLYVSNESFELAREHSGSGVATNIYKRSEELWKHMANGKDVEISLTANMEVGVYAWAKKGFEFSDKRDAMLAQHALKNWLVKNGCYVDETIKGCGYNDISEINSAKQFAELHNPNIMFELEGNEYLKKEIAKVGKAFMLMGMKSWSGVKKIRGADYFEGDKS